MKVVFSRVSFIILDVFLLFIFSQTSLSISDRYNPSAQNDLSINKVAYAFENNIENKENDLSLQDSALGDRIEIPKKVYREIKKGDIIGRESNIEFNGKILNYEHYAVYIGNGEVINYSPFNGVLEDLKVEIADLNKSFPGCSYFVLDFSNFSTVFSPDETIKRAYSRMGEKSYSLVNNNCENFVIWCKTGKSISYQLQKLSLIELFQVEVYEKLNILISKSDRLILQNILTICREHKDWQ